MPKKTITLLTPALEYIKNNFDNIKKYENIIEKRLTDDFTLEDAIKDNQKVLAGAKKHNLNYILIDKKYEL